MTSIKTLKAASVPFAVHILLVLPQHDAPDRGEVAEVALVPFLLEVDGLDVLREGRGVRGRVGAVLAHLVLGRDGAVHLFEVVPQGVEVGALREESEIKFSLSAPN